MQAHTNWIPLFSHAFHNLMMKQLGINFRYDLRYMQVSEKDFLSFCLFLCLLYVH